MEKIEKAKHVEDMQKKENIGDDPYTAISDEELDKLYIVLEEKCSLTIYRERLFKFANLLKGAFEDFKELPKADKVFTLIEVLGLLRTTEFSSAKGSDLSKIGGSRQAGVFSKSQDLKNADTFSIILQSVTGLFEQEVKIK